MFSTLTTINGYNPIKALFLKEFWDNKRAILITPMVITGLILFLLPIALFSESGIMINGASWNEHLSHADNLENKIMFPAMVPSAIIAISFIFSMIFTSLSVLFDERKNKSILFWKSMPISDTQEVLIKLATVIVVTPIIAICFAFIIQLYTILVLGLFVTAFSDYSAWEIVFSNINFLAIITIDLVPTFVMILWTLPIFTWFMLVSSFSRRSPFLLAFIIPILTIVIEKIFFDGSLILHAITSRFSYLENYIDRFDLDGGGNIIEGITSLLGSFGEPSFWVGIAFAAAMIAGCIQLRKRNSIT